MFFVNRNIGAEEKEFIRVARKKNMEIIPINLYKKFDEEEFEKQIRKCDIIYNNSAEEFVIEPLKTVEELGKKVIDTSKFYYYTEDKWMFYIKCKEHKIPAPETILLSNNLTMARAELKEFGQWLVILKRIYGSCGDYVQKADKLNDAIKIIKKIWKRDCDKVPIIAQEFIKSYSYRVTVINKKPVQTAIKTSKNWKCTGVYQKKCNKFRIDSKLKKILNKLAGMANIGIFGVDLLKKGKQWIVLEINAEPALDFIDGERELLIGKILDFLKSYHKKHCNRQ